MNARMSLEEFYHTHFEELCFYSYSYVADIEVSKDIVQEAFLSLWMNRERYTPTRALLYTFVRNRAIDHLREKNRSRIFHNSDLQATALDRYVTELVITQEDYLTLEDLSREISQSIESLPPQCRRIFEMSRFRNMNNKGIARELDISIKGVEKQITKALSAIYRHLNKAGFLCLVPFFRDTF